MVTNIQSITSPAPQGSSVNNSSPQKSPAGQNKESMTAEEQALEQEKQEMREEEEARLAEAEEALKNAIENSPEFIEIKDNIIIDMTHEGLRIQVIDREGKPMFAKGSSRMYEKTEKLLQKISEVIQTQPNFISVRGHTDSLSYGRNSNYSNWELSADRANSSRRALIESGYKPAKVFDVVGKADTELLYPKEPTNAGNRRISITLLREELTNPDYNKKASQRVNKAKKEKKKPDSGSNTNTKKSTPMPKIVTFKKTPGSVEFP
ncbi:MAG: OmpA family protein, partial [Micavibrio sp.]|nr:OmpA family protein [Micavibrio sp.]